MSAASECSDAAVVRSPANSRTFRSSTSFERSNPVELLFTDWLGTPAWFWLAFLGLVISLTAFDLGILHKEDREMGIAESLKLSVFYIAIALMFGGWIWYARGSEPGMQYLTGYFIEKALSIDNVFVI